MVVNWRESERKKKEGGRRMIGGFYVWPSVYRVGCGESTRVIGKFATYFFFLQIGQMSVWRVKSNNSVRYALSLSLAAWLAKERKKKGK